MEIKKENAIAAYNAADENTKKVFLSLLPELEEAIKPKDITERVKTFEDACRELGENHLFVLHYRFNHSKDSCWTDKVHASDLEAFLKLRIICAALNEGWEPQFTEDEWRWYPCFTLWTEEELSEKSDEWKADRHLISTGDYSGDYAGFAYADSSDAPSDSYPNVSSRLCLKSEALATYCGKQFISLWADFNLIRK